MSRFIYFVVIYGNMVKKVIIAYSLEKVKTPLKITRRIYGYTECSNYSKYKYEREGILSNIKYEKLSRACIMIDAKDAAKTIKEFKKLKIKVKILEVELKKKTDF